MIPIRVNRREFSRNLRMYWGKRVNIYDRDGKIVGHFVPPNVNLEDVGDGLTVSDIDRLRIDNILSHFRRNEEKIDWIYEFLKKHDE